MRDLLLCNGGGEVDIPGGQAGERLRIARKQAMQECGPAAQIAQDEKRFVYGLGFMGGEENVIEPEKKPMDERSDGPDQVEKRQEDDPFSSESSGGVFG